jgi:hypothetical protein
VASVRTRVASLVVAALVAAVLAACTGGPAPAVTLPLGSPAPTSPGSSSVASGGPTEAEPTEAKPTEPGATGAPPTVAPPTTQPGQPSPGASAPVASPGLSLDSMTIPHSARCDSDNGTGTVGMIRISWSATGTTGVRISIDPPSPDVAYDYPFADYPATGSTDLPFACGPSTSDANGAYHLYVVTTLKVAGHASYRYAKVYDVTPSATP